MKRTVLVYGLIAGLIAFCPMIYSMVRSYQGADYEGSMVVGYAAMLLAFSFVFVGVKSFRDTHHQGAITFGKAFQIGLLITLVASSVYVAGWLIDYYVFVPDYMEKYVAHVLKEMKAQGASPSELQQQEADLATYVRLYKSPFWVVLLTYAEVLPVGLLLSLLSAWVLRRKSASTPTAQGG